MIHHNRFIRPVFVNVVTFGVVAYSIAKKIPFAFMMLTALLVALQLKHVIAWSWWQVFAPTWIPFSLLAMVFLVVNQKRKKMSAMSAA
jgi:hypothetical protein